MNSLEHILRNIPQITEDIIQNFKDHGITIELLKDISDEHLKELCPQISTRILLKKGIERYLTSIADTTTLTTLTDTETTKTTEDSILDISLTLFNDRPSFPEFDLQTLLSTSPLGNSVLTHYKFYGTLDNKRRTILTDIIIRHLFTRIVNHRITHEEYNIIAAKIVTLFPTESVGTYFVKPIKKCYSINGKSIFAKGKLVDKVRNLLFNSGERKRKSTICPGNNVKSIKVQRQDINLEDQFKEELLWLNHNNEPWSTVLEKWTETYDLRRSFDGKSVNEFLTKFPILKDLRGESLIQYDFNQMYPGRENNLYMKWKFFFNKILELKTKDKLDSQVSIYTELLKEINDNDKRLIIEIIILGHIIPPKGRLNRKIKFSTAEAIESIVVQVESPGDVEKKIRDQKQKAALYNQTVQPYVLIVGNLVHQESPQLYIIIDEIRYQFKSAYKAFDILFKIFHVLHVMYPPQSQHLHLIIQRKIYNIITDFDSVPPYICEILSQ